MVLYFSLEQVIDWQNLGKKMSGLGRLCYGLKSYDQIKMWKALILQVWHSLSDSGLEEALRVRMDCMMITELTDVPDETRICYFLNRLIQQGLISVLLYEVNTQLISWGFKARESKSAIVDAIIIQSACHHRSRRWLYRHSSYHTRLRFGDQRVDGIAADGRRRMLVGYKGYSSQANQELLIERGWLWRRTKRGEPLSKAQKACNKLISKTCNKVEQAFETLKRRR